MKSINHIYNTSVKLHANYYIVMLHVKLFWLISICLKYKVHDIKTIYADGTTSTCIRLQRYTFKEDADDIAKTLICSKFKLYTIVNYHILIVSFIILVLLYFICIA